MLTQRKANFPLSQGVQAKVDAEVAAKAAREFEEKHGLIASKLAAGLKSSKKAAAQPSRANKPKDPAAAKGKGEDYKCVSCSIQQ